MLDIVPELQLRIGEHDYQISRMSVFDQMNVASECRDILIGLAMLKRERPKDMTDETYASAVQFMIMARAGMSDDTRARVTSTCFNHITRRAAGGYQKILAAPGTMQFNDIGLTEAAKLLYGTFEHNKFLDFFSESPSALGGLTEAATSNGQA